MINLILFTALAHAKLDFNPAHCPAPSVLASQIKVCSQNKLATQAAKNCQAALQQSWKKVNAELQKALAAAGTATDAGQRNTLSTSQRDYARVLVDLDAQIKLQQKYTAYVAAYPSAMVDYKGAGTADESATCFNENFDPIQAMVQTLDKEIVEAKAAMKGATALFKTTSTRHSKVEALPRTAPLVTQPKAAETTGGDKPKTPGYRASDVSGTDDAFIVRD